MAKTKGIIVELGGDASGLNKAISSVSKEARDTQSELKKIERLLKMDPGNVTLLKQKQELLNESISKTEDVITALKDAKDRADADMANGTEINEKAYRELERQIEANEITLKNTRKEADKVADALNGIDSDEIRDVARAADDAEEALEGAAKKAADLGDVLKANMISDAASGIVDSLKDVAEETKEYRKIRASLEVSSEAAGYSAEETAETYKQLFGVLADEQSAATATANLQALKLSQEQLTEMTNAAIGAWSRYGDSISIDSLTEAINHTAQLGEVQSSLADVLEWAGYSVDDFNAKLATCSSTSERADMILQMMTDQGLTAAGEKWRENNASMVEANEATARLQEQMAQLGETIEPMMTMLTELATQALGWFNNLDEGTQKFILGTVLLVAALGPVMAAFGSFSGGINSIIQLLPKFQNMFTTVFGFIAANPVVLLIGAIVGLVAIVAAKGDEIQGVLQRVDDFLQGVFATDWTNIFGPVLGNVLNGFFANLQNVWNAVMQILNGVIDFVRGVFTGDWERAWSGIVQIFDGIFSGIYALAAAPINGIIGLINDAIDGINWLIAGINKIPGVSIGNIGKIPMLADGGTVWSGSAIVGEAGPELLTVTGGKAVVQPLTANTGKIEGLLGDISSQLGGGGYDIPIVVQVMINEDVVGETAVTYIRRQDRAYGK